MSSSTSHKRGAHQRGAHSGGGGSHGDEGGGGGGGGGGPLVKVAFGRNQAEAEMLQGLLTEAGIPSVLKRSGGFDNPDFLSAGPHDVYVVSDLAQKARDVLAETMIESETDEAAELREQRRLARGGDQTSAGTLALWVVAVAIGGLILVWILYQLS
jgi:hypothetical protein